MKFERTDVVDIRVGGEVLRAAVWAVGPVARDIVRSHCRCCSHRGVRVAGIRDEVHIRYDTTAFPLLLTCVPEAVRQVRRHGWMDWPEDT